MDKKINAETNLGELMAQPRAVEVLARYQLPCLGCPMAAHEIGQLTLGQVAERYGLPLEKIIEDLQGL